MFNQRPSGAVWKGKRRKGEKKRTEGPNKLIRCWGSFEWPQSSIFIQSSTACVSQKDTLPLYSSKKEQNRVF